MDHREQDNQANHQETNFSDTIRFQAVEGQTIPEQEEANLSAEEILDEYLKAQEQTGAAEPSTSSAPEGERPGAPRKPVGAMIQELPSPDTGEDPTVVEAPERKRTTPWDVVWTISKHVWRIGLGIALTGVILVLGLVGYLTVTEYNPSYAENADRGSVNRSETILPRTMSVLTFNTGYGGLGADADFFMDGGEGVLPEDQGQVEGNLAGIEGILDLADPDFIFLQEVDTGSRRSFETNQWLRYEHTLEEYESRFALNYSCDYVPYPYTEPMGEIQSGIATYSKFDIVSSTRFSLPNGFTWPNRVANLKRCLLVTRIPIEDSEQQLVLINLHMEAYDDGDVREEQIRMLTDLVEEEYAKGNFVIAGGDFNSTFPDCSGYEVKNPDLWTPGVLDRILGGLRYIYDDNTPTCRLLNQPYDPDSEETQYYVIDGFLVSPNVIVNRVETLDYEFFYSDHNPVLLEFTLRFDQ